ncbi:GDSL esterase/lipase EXL3-like [Phalaenopsis equestris]|uniref:GDSL esterase/lipase EXL3-like n=1 Tax=Phalaenopsis equestris TaxID=78828 RepID=UPI0009E54308|nr:GDSL esterase/lipase EXL3-like [Phalaenopsis equestris]
MRRTSQGDSEAILHVLAVFYCLCLSTKLTTGFAVNQTIKPPVPAVILFGDSILDSGNNNNIKTLLKCNFPPYGKDFVGHIPTGRFSNGKIPGDIIASSLGVKELVPAYLSPKLGDEELLTGVSFASGSTGYDPITSIVASVISMEDQLKLFEEYKEKVEAIAGKARAEIIISESLFIVCAGTNDFINTYFPTLFRKLHYDVPSYVNFLVAKASDFVQKLYKMGARRIGFIGLPPIGCLPSQISFAGYTARECVEAHNQAALLYNSKISAEIKSLATNFRDKKLVYINIYTILFDIIQRPSLYGFEVSDKGCCGTGAFEVGILCNNKSHVCSDDTKYIFWDSFHPTEKAYMAIVDRMLQEYIKYLI